MEDIERLAQEIDNRFKFSWLPLIMTGKNAGKRPLEKDWQRWCEKRRPFSEINHKGNIGITTGPASGVIVLDIDDLEQFKRICEEKSLTVPETFTVRTGGGGEHKYYIYPTDGNRYGNRSHRLDKVGVFDVRGIGGQVVAPGSVHLETGNTYHVVNDKDIADAPQWLLDYSLTGNLGGKTTPSALMKKTPPTAVTMADWGHNIDRLPIKRETKSLITSGVPEGDRSEAMMTVLCALVWSNLTDDDIVSIFEVEAIGEKYRSVGHTRERWLTKQIEKARTWSTNRAEPYHSTYNKKQPSFDFSDLDNEDQKTQLTRKELAAQIESTDDFDELTGPIAERVATSGLKPTETLSLRKFIARKAKVSVKSLVKDAESFKSVQVGKDAFHLETAQKAIGLYGDGNLIFSAEFFWHYRKGLWSAKDDWAFKQSIHKIIANAEQDATKTTVASILDLAKTEAFIDDHTFDIGGKYVVNCKNGELHFDENIGYYPELKPHCRENYRTSQIPVEYDHKAPAARFLQFLDEIFINDADREEKKKLLLEMVGYTMTTSCDFEKFIILIGRGANGKSVLLDVLMAVLGRNTVCAVKPNQLDNRFQRAHLHAKLANIVTEIEEGAVVADAELKSLTSGELTTAEHKHKPPFDFSPYATFWFATNHMPHTRDFSDALFRRALIISFNRIFTEPEQDKNLKSKLLKELPGILKLAVVAFSKVLIRGEFTKVESSEQAKKEWRIEADQVAQFFEECCRLDPNQGVESSRLYNNYTAWANSAGINKTLNRKNFTNRVERLGVTKGRGSGGIRMMHGVLITNPQLFVSLAQ